MTETNERTGKTGHIVGQAELPTTSFFINDELRNQIESGESFLVIDIAGNRFTHPTCLANDYTNALNDAILERARIEIKKELNQIETQREVVLIDTQGTPAL